MYRLKEFPGVSAMDYVATLPQAYLAALPNRVDGFAVGAAIFYTIDELPYLLIIKRSASDTMPNLWELPAGGVDAEDASIADALSRETKEETGLTVAWLIQEIGRGATWQTNRNGGVQDWLKICFVVEIEEIECLEREAKAAQNQPKVLQYRSDLSSTLAKVPVTLNPAEHQRYLWVTEEQVAKREADGEKLVYVSEDQRQVMLDAFEIQKHIIAAKADV